jgi:hypothetical protein
MRVGEPNVLSDAATPNVLSTQAGRPKPLPVNRSGQQVVLRPAVPTAAGSEGWLTTGQAAAPSRVRLPSFGTLIFLGFLAITAFRLVGEFASGITTPTAGPVATSPAGPGGGAPPGPITFGTGLGSDCDVTGLADEFGPADEVWWSAQLATMQPPEASAIVIVRRNGVEVDHQLVPPDASVGEWSVLCAGEPIDLHDPGTYRVEVWTKDESVLHAAGEYRVRGS